MAETARTIEITETKRVVVYYDDFDQHECPASWGDPADRGMFVIREPRNSASGLKFGNDADDARDAMEAWEEHLPYQQYYRPEPSDAALKHLRRKGFQANVFTIYGGSQSDWIDVVLWDRHDLESVRKAVSQWMRGEIYLVTYQTRETWLSQRVEPVDDDGSHWDVSHVWGVEESVGGVYFQSLDDNEVIEFAHENWGNPLPDTKPEP